MSDFKYSIGDEVLTEFNSTLLRRVVTRHTITGREKGQSQSGNIFPNRYMVDPPLGSGHGTDENWFRPVNTEE